MTDKFRERAISLFNSKAWCDADLNGVRGLSDHVPLLAQALADVDAEATERAARIAESYCANMEGGQTRAAINIAEFIRRSQPDPTKKEG